MRAPLDEIASSCLLMRTRLLSRVVSGIYQRALDPFEINVAQFVLLVVIGGKRDASRAEIGRALHQDRSTLTRNLRALLAAGWVREGDPGPDGRARPLALTGAGEDLVRGAVPAWRSAQRAAIRLLGAEPASVMSAAANRLLTEATS